MCVGANDAVANAVSGLKKDKDSRILGDSFYIVADEAYICTEKLINIFTRDNIDQMNFNYIPVLHAHSYLTSVWHACSTLAYS